MANEWTTMESVIVKATDILLSQPPEKLLDKDDWIVNGIVKGVDSFSKICKIAALHRHKNYTDAKKEEIGTELSKILFHAGCLVHLLDVDPSIFDVESLTAFSEEFPMDYQQDVILCSLDAIRNFVFLAEDKFTDLEEEVDFLADVPEEAGTDEVVSSTSLLPDDEEDDTEPAETALAEIFSSVIILCELVELDLETIMYNAGVSVKL